MTQDNKKIITVTFVLTGILVGFTVNLLLGFLASHFSMFARVESSTELSNGIPVVAGLLIFGILQFTPKVVNFVDGVVDELKKVVWPSRKDTGLMTVVVTVTLIISGVIVGVYDSIWAFVINRLIK